MKVFLFANLGGTVLTRRLALAGGANLLETTEVLNWMFNFSCDCLWF